MRNESRKEFRWGIASLVEEPMPSYAERARHHEELGYRDIWIPDERLLRNVYVSLATVATATTRIGMGTAVTNPYTRHPAHTAAAIATIDELSGGRARLALGAGGGLDAYGIARTRPVTTLRESIEVIRGLLANETLRYEGEIFTLRNAQIDFDVSPVPIYLAGRGPQILTLAGEVADGAIIGGFATESGIHYAQDLIDRGVAKAGRRPDDVDRMAWIYISVSDDPAAARTAVSKMVLASLITSRPILDKLGIDIPPALRDHLDSTGWRYPLETPAQASALLPDEIVNAFAVHGTPADCLEQLKAVRRAGIDHVTFVPFPPAGDTLDRLAERIARDVVPSLLEQ
ncbi:MAG: LLM class flavin-dependent oxidoreductase [Cryobacterium sp.]|nr:LLM class flavin-dependent oxidoreductase [Cryobacterium sp.]